jgi:N-acetylglucosamine kinase-like BadF-type ATPase
MLRRLLAGIVGGEIEIIGDMETAFEDAFGAGAGVIIISGVGSIAYGKNALGETARAGGMGARDFRRRFRALDRGSCDPSRTASA